MRVPPLFVDLYALTMLQAYFAEGLTDRAVFRLFVRRLPPSRNVLLACGLEQVLSYLEELRISEADLDHLRSLDRFSPAFLDTLRTLRFTGDVYAMPEGTPFFPDEAIVEIDAPLPEAQYIETCVMNQITVQTVLASKAARVVHAARGREVVDFGARRAHGVEAAVLGARACWIAGVHATSNVEAGRAFGLPVAGTMAHSYIQAHDDETGAFRAFAQTFPGTVLLVDTYDTLEGVRRVIDLATRGPAPVQVGAVRLDSGDLASLARETRRLLDAAGLNDVGIFASSGLDEHQVAALVNAQAPIDGFGVGTGMLVSSDAPALDVAYKLCAYAGHDRTKLSMAKPILPGRTQVVRQETGAGSVGDVIAEREAPPEGRPLLRCVMRDGVRVPDAAETLEAARRRAAREWAALPEHVTDLTEASPPYPVTISPALRTRHERLVARLGDRQDQGA